MAESTNSSSMCRKEKDINYNGLDVKAMEILSKRPIKRHRDEVFKLRKVTMQTFLRNNGYPANISENKTVLTGRILQLISMSQTPSADSVSSGRVSSISSEQLAKVPGIPNELLVGLPQGSVDFLKVMSTWKRHSIEKVLLDYGGVSNDELTKDDILKQLAELLSEQIHAEQDLLNRSTRNSCSPLECCICMDNVISVAFNPCGHACSCDCCAVDMKMCPLCRQEIGSVLHLRFP